MNHPYARNGNWICQKIGDGNDGALFPIRRSEADLTTVLTLNETALFIWERLESPLPLTAIHSKLVQEFGSEPLMSDLEEFLTELCQLGVLVQQVPLHVRSE